MAVIDEDNHRPPFGAEAAANARARAAGEVRERLREDSLRLEKEASIACAIASELFARLLDSAPESAYAASASILSHYDTYRDDPRFPNVRELLAKFARAVRVV